MAYYRTPYVGMTPKKMAATLKVTNDTLKMSVLDRSTASTSHISHYRVVPGETTLLESIAQVPTGKSLKRANRVSSDFLSFFFPSPR